MAAILTNLKQRNLSCHMILIPSGPLCALAHKQKK